MKLNFDYCKTCNEMSYFYTRCDEECEHYQLVFYCPKAIGVEFDIGKYKFEKFKYLVTLPNVTEKEWNDIKQMKIVWHDPKGFIKCSYHLEHIVDDQS